MNRKKMLLVLASAAFVVILIWSTRHGQAPKVVEGKPLPPQLRASRDSAVNQLTPPSTVSAATGAKALPEKKESTSDDKSVKIKAALVLVTVNGVAITGLDLVPLNSAEPNKEATLSEGLYRYLLDRAIVRELAFQEAKREGIELTPSQQQQLDAQRENLRKTEAAEDAAGAIVHLNRTGTLEDEIAFRTRDGAAFLLLNSLMDRAGVSPMLPSSTQIEEYYKAHTAEYGSLPVDPDQRAAAWNEIFNDISRRVQSATLQAHVEQRQQYIDQLKAAAQIVTNQPSS